MTSFSSLEHLNSNNSPFRFNAKELDCLSREAVRFGKETGNYYYGARYYDPKWSIWISVDPLAEQMPEWSSYAYTFNNPVRFIDPDGRAPNDIIVNMYSSITNSLEPILIIRTKLKAEFNIKGEHFLTNGITRKPEFIEYFLPEVDVIDAFGFEFGGDIVIGGGGAKSVSLVAFLKGEDEGDVFFYGNKSINAGFDISPSISLKKYYANNVDVFNKYSLEGQEIDLNISGQGLGKSFFIGIDNFYNPVYYGDSTNLTPGVGPGSLYKGNSELLDYLDINYQLPDEQKFDTYNECYDE